MTILTRCPRCDGDLLQVEHLPGLGTGIWWRCQDCGATTHAALHVQLEKMGCTRLPGF